MVVSMGTLIVLIAGGNVAQMSQVVTSNVSFAMDSISREIRTGYNFYCTDANDLSDALSADPFASDTNDCATGNELIAFSDGETGFRTAYFLNPNDSTIYALIAVDPDDESTSFPFPLTSDDVIIDDVQFFLTGSTAGDNEQPQIRILVTGRPSTTQDVAPFYLQTTIVGRTLDL